MAGRFSNTQYNDTVNSLVSTMKKVINNNFYKYSDKAPTSTTYYHLNKEASSLDEASRLAYNNVGDDSPFFYNKINNMMIYGIEQIQMQYTSEDFGVESAAIEGEGIILPNTIEPYPDDQFCITHLQKQIVFKITHVEPDTLEDGSNIYKINYRSSTSTLENLEQQVIEEFDFIITNVGTELNPILKTEVTDFIKKIENITFTLKQYYKRIFYNKRVQTFTFKYREDYFYDPYLIEFLKRNKVLEGDGEYIYIQHQTQLDPLFSVNYTKTMFYCIEKKDVDNVDGYYYTGAGKLIENKFTIFLNRMEDYWEVFYDYPQGYEFLKLVPCFKKVLIDHISDSELIESKKYSFYNIIVKFMHNADLTINDLKSVDTICYENNPTLFYAIPCIIYCLNQYITLLLKTE